MSADGGGSQDLKFVAAANRPLASAWARGLLSEPPLDSASLIAKAERLEKSPVEPGSWQERLDVLTKDLRDSVMLNPLGRAMAYGQFVGILRQRIRASRLWRRRPEIFQHPIERLVVILGQMRSGTTLTHRLLACDPRFSFTRLHETLAPLAGRRMAGPWRASFVAGLLNVLNPSLSSAHATSARAAEEEFGLHAFSLHGAMFEGQWHIPNFARWSEQSDLAPVYREFRQLLQTLRWRRADPVQSIQLLKAPQFMQDLPALLHELPDSRMIMLVRDRADVMASSASLVSNQQRIQSDAVDALRIGAEWRRKTMLREERAWKALELVPQDRLLTIQFERLQADWEREVRRTYDYLGLNLTPSTLTRMAGVANAGSHRGHRYSAAQFGLEK